MKRYILSIIILLVVSFGVVFSRQQVRYVNLNIKNGIGIGFGSRDIYFKGFYYKVRGSKKIKKTLECEASPDTYDDFYRILSRRIRKTSCASGRRCFLTIKTANGIYDVTLKIDKFSLNDWTYDPNCSIHLNKRDLLSKKAIEGFKCVVEDIAKID